MKKADQTLPLGVLFIAVQLSDLVYGVTLLSGLEKIIILPGTNPLTSAEYIFFPLSHSLVATILWAGLVTLIFHIAPFTTSIRKRKTTLILVTAILSHFLLDALVHNPELDLLGNGIYKIGFGLWNYPLASYIVEALFLVTGLWMYQRTIHSKNFSGKYGLPILSGILLILNATNTFGLIPTNTEFFALTMLAIYLSTIVVAFWLDRRSTH